MRASSSKGENPSVVIRGEVPPLPPLLLLPLLLVAPEYWLGARREDESANKAASSAC